jgi:hypothetical protein
MRTFLLICALVDLSSYRAVGEEPAARGVVFDFNVPVQDRDVDFACTVEFATGGGKPYLYDLNGPLINTEDLAFMFHGSLKGSNIKGSNIKADIVNKTQVRVFGIEKDGKFYPALKGTVTSKTLPADARPKVTNPPKA